MPKQMRRKCLFFRSGFDALLLQSGAGMSRLNCLLAGLMIEKTGKGAESAGT
jgi:hypothetical protein